MVAETSMDSTLSFSTASTHSAVMPEDARNRAYGRGPVMTVVYVEAVR
jgi:hypothetical protein